MRFHRERDATATIALTEVEDPSRYGVVVTDGDGAVEAFVEKPPPGTVSSRDINAGTYVLEPGVLELIPPDRAVSIEREVFPLLVGQGLYASSAPGGWRDIGTPESYVAANLEHMPPGGLHHPTARISPAATVRDCVVGAHVVVEDGAVVERAVLLEGARVAARAQLRDCVVGPGREVPPAEQRSGGIVW
jgi:mannose-1-phosphate guanylyltransferase